MSYIGRTVVTNEYIVAEFRPHWINYISVFFAVIFGFFFSILSIMFIPTPEFFPLAIASIACFSYSLCRFIKIYTREYGITNKRVIAKIGFIFVNADELRNSKIESVEIKQTLLGRILGYGNLYLAGTGTSEVIMPKIKKPYFAKKIVEECISDL